MPVSARRRWCWLSFADPTRPSGQQFLGATIVEAAPTLDDVLTLTARLGGKEPNEAQLVTMAAIRRAWALGVNPGGEVGLWDLATEAVPGPEWRDRLLDLDELERLEHEMRDPPRRA